MQLYTICIVLTTFVNQKTIPLWMVYGQRNL